MSKSFVHTSGLVAIIAGILSAVGAGIHPAVDDVAGITDPTWIPSHVLLWFGFALGLFGWVGVYERQSEKAGTLGTAGFVILFLGAVGMSRILMDAATTVPFIAAEAPTVIPSLNEAYRSSSFFLMGLGAILAFVIGGTILGLAIVRARVLSPVAGSIITVGSIFLLVAGLAGLPEKVFDAGVIIFSLGQVLLGRSVWMSTK